MTKIPNDIKFFFMFYLYHVLLKFRREPETLRFQFNWKLSNTTKFVAKNISAESALSYY